LRNINEEKEEYIYMFQFWILRPFISHVPCIKLATVDAVSVAEVVQNFQRLLGA